MSDICSPESATASLTAVRACTASGVSAVRDTFENPTPDTATLHRFSHMRVPHLRRRAEKRSAFRQATCSILADDASLIRPTVPRSTYCRQPELRQRYVIVELF